MIRASALGIEYSEVTCGRSWGFDYSLPGSVFLSKLASHNLKTIYQTVEVRSL